MVGDEGRFHVDLMAVTWSSVICTFIWLTRASREFTSRTRSIISETQRFDITLIASYHIPPAVTAASERNVLDDDPGPVDSPSPHDFARGLGVDASR